MSQKGAFFILILARRLFSLPVHGAVGRLVKLQLGSGAYTNVPEGVKEYSSVGRAMPRQVFVLEVGAFRSDGRVSLAGQLLWR